MSVNASQVIKGESLDVTAYHSLPAAMEKVVAHEGLPGLARCLLILPFSGRHAMALAERAGEYT